VSDPSRYPADPGHPRGPTPATRWLAILLLLVAAALVWTVLRQRRQEVAPPPVPRAVTPRGDLAADERATIELFRQVSPSVVHITSIQLRRSSLTLNVFEIPQGTGTGFLWDNRGHLVTNFHVVQSGQSTEVTLNDGSVWRGTIVGTAPHKDLAVVKIDAPAERLRPIAVGRSSDLLVGQKVFAIGNPFGLDQTLTTGVISGLGREIQSMTRRPIQDVIQTDAAINPGNSGGPLLDSAGRLIGVNTQIYSPSGAYAGIGFAVPADTVNRIVPQLISHGRVVSPGLGITVGPDDWAARLNIEGVLVIEVMPDSAAAAAGLQGTRRGPDGSLIVGDVIVGIDGQPVKNSNDLFRIIDKHEVGDTVNVEVQRRTGRTRLAIKLQPVPS
jgi:S1-C subfamily serine protease